MRTALCLGGSRALFDDLRRVHLPFDGVIACNEAGEKWPGKLDAWVSLHPSKMGGWLAQRRANGFPDPERFLAHRQTAGPVPMDEAPYMLPGVRQSMSSGGFCVVVALEVLGFDRCILAGIGLSEEPHYFDAKAWMSARHFRRAWGQASDEHLERLRSMSGWTRVLCGSPRDWEAELAG